MSEKWGVNLVRDCIICGRFVSPESTVPFCTTCASTAWSAAVVAALLQQVAELKRQLAAAEARLRGDAG
jgi:hypothetical protein